VLFFSGKLTTKTFRDNRGEATIRSRYSLFSSARAGAVLKGLDWTSNGPPWPFRWTLCGSRGNKMIVSPGTRNMRSDDDVADTRVR